MAKIVHITTVHPALDIRIFQKQCRTLAEAGHDVTLIAPRDNPHTEEVDGVKICALPKPHGRRERMFHTVRLALRVALSLDADLYHLHDPELLTIARRLRRRGRQCRPVVFDMHENLPKDLLTKPWLPVSLRGPASHAAGLAQRVLLRGISVVMAEDSYAADYPWLPDATIVRNMPLVDELLTIERHQSKSTVPKLGYMGSISPSRGSTATLEALGILRKQGIHCGLELVGPMANHSHANELHEQPGQLGLDHISITGWLPAPEAWQRMAGCQIGLALLQNQPNFVHSFPTKMFEYMALGLPVVVSDFPLYRQVVESTGCGLCVDSKDPKAIAAAFAQLLNNPEEAQAMGRRGRRAVVERYRWSEEAKKLLDLYECLIEVSTISITHPRTAA
ncbi:MAG: glycosyltransferase family 4 protein [Pirellulales bacterium]|nr:glycosyltransferase family 4 protein [Pirellulales bacterium]